VSSERKDEGLEDDKEQARNPKRDANVLRPRMTKHTDRYGGYCDNTSLLIVEGAGPFYICEAFEYLHAELY
jgi:hypothetical protein